MLRETTYTSEYLFNSAIKPFLKFFSDAAKLASLAGVLTFYGALCHPIPASAVNLSYSTQFGTVGSGSGQFSSPTGVAVDSAGNIYVADFNNDRIARFDPSNFAGTFTSFGTTGFGSGQFMNPTGVAVDSSGNVYVADNGNHRIARFNPTNFAGTFTSFGTYGADNEQFDNPVGIAVDSASNVYVADLNNRIARFNPTNFAGTFTSFGSGQFGFPGSGHDFGFNLGVAVDSAGNVYVGDSANNRIARFNPSNFAGTFTSFGTAGSGYGQFRFPIGVAVDSAGNVYVGDGNNRIVTFDPSNFAGTFTSFGTAGSGSGQFNNPFGVAVDSAGSLYVADTSNSRIQVLSTVPFEFSPTLGLALLGSLWLGKRLIKQVRNKKAMTLT